MNDADDTATSGHDGGIDSAGQAPETAQDRVSQQALEKSATTPRWNALRLTRRQLLIASGVAGTAGVALLLGFTLRARQQPSPQVKSFSPSVWLRIDADNTVTITVGRCETGQGILTGLAMLVAEELDADWGRVRVQQAPAGEQYGNQRTTGSGSMAGSFTTMRLAGAQARALLVAAAARGWGVAASTCQTERGAVLHPSSGRRLSYGQLTDAAAREPLSSAAHPAIREPSQFRLIGTRTPRVDTPSKIDGSALFGLDMRLPGMLFAVVARSPVPGGVVASVDSTRAQAVPGVRKVVQIPGGVAVVAEHTWAAIRGRRALDVQWNEGANATLSSDGIRQQLAALAPQPDAAPGGTRVVHANYETPYQTHAPMEPLNCIARLEHGACEIWIGTQDPQGARLAASLASGVALDRVQVHVLFSGGGFGRRAGTDVVSEATLVAKAVGAPVQVIWTREDDLQQGFYRPAAYQRLQATVDGGGKIQSWQHGIAAQSMGDSVGAGAELPYATATPRVTGAEGVFGIPVTIWRGGEYSYTTFAIESFIDEIAGAIGADPYQFRRGLLASNSRMATVLDLAASKAGWGAALPPGWGRGVAVCFYANTAVAEVAEVAVTADKTVRAHRVVCAVDCGLVVNPNLAEAQIEGAITQGLSAALKGEITFSDGKVQQHNFDDYPLLRLNEAPSVEVYLVPSSADPTGLGEAALPPLAPAIANAVYAATGKRVRRLPIRREDLR